MKLYKFILFLALAITGCRRNLPAIEPVQLAPVQPTKIFWYDYTDDLIKYAKENNKRVFIYIKETAEYLNESPCEKFEDETLKDPVIIKILGDRYISAIVFVTGEPELAALFKVTATPKLIFIGITSDWLLKEAEYTGCYSPIEMVNILEDIENEFE